MGYTVRTDGWRYTEWVGWNQSTLRPVWSAVAGVELYDHRSQVIFPTNFDVAENENVAGNETLASVMQHLSALIKTMFGNDTHVL